MTHTDGFPQVVPSADAALIGRINIAAGDHVSVRRAAELPAFNGIVTNVVQSLDDIDDEAFHPVIDGLRPHPFRRYLRIQVFLINDDSRQIKKKIITVRFICFLLQALLCRIYINNMCKQV